jgi:pimeloyl-ACP methyl ester carboxylesterase
MSSVDSGGVRIDYEVHGPASGEAVLLLHGFPDTRRMWRHQIGPLVDEGFRVIVPDQRGYGRSDKPTAVDDYNLVHLAGDALAVLDDAGVPSATVVGHDWGSPVAWALASLTPDRVDRLVALSVGHPAALLSAGIAQREKSWYMLLFQFEGVAERWLSDDDWAKMKAWVSHPDHDEVVAALEADGSLTPALNWYRANVPPTSLIEPPPELPPVQAPTMGVWSSGDEVLLEDQMLASGAYCANGFRYERIEGAGHWIPLSAPDALNALLIDFLT